MTSRSTFWFRRIVSLLAVGVLAIGVALVVDELTGDGDPDADTLTTTEPPIDTSVFSDPARVGRPYGTTVEGMLTFRGNPTRSYYGKGPVPSKPGVAWFHPAKGGLCGSSSVGGASKVWCGSGWTG
ncbi:MAG TPA: hypothetical protein VJM33_14010, partial [Microthrixaceae bacterium]|nr:hypothetical protein [Microthrixaceae bacterium]